MTGMDVNVTLATWSNLLIYSAMAVYAIAFLIYSSDLFAGRTLGGSASRQTGAARTARRGSAERTTARSTRTRTAAKAAGSKSSSPGAAVAVLDVDHDTAPEAEAGSGTSVTDVSAPVPVKRTAARMATSLTILAAGLHIAAVITRALSVSRVPWGNMMEYALTASAIAVAVYVIVLYWNDVRYLGTFVAGGALVTLGLCITVFYTPAAQLVPALQSYWIWIHVPIAILSTALLSVSAIMAVFQILKARAEKQEAGESSADVAAAGSKAAGAKAAGAKATGAGATRLGRLFARVPASEAIEQTSYRIAAVGFVTWTFTLIAGAIWAEVAWGRPWGWDPKEIWTFVVWVVYAAYLHARATRGWSATQVAVLNIIGFTSVLFNFGIVNVYFNGLHAYSGL